MFEDKTQNNIMIDLIETVDSDISTEEGTLINHSFVGAATEFEKTYIELEIIDRNGNAETADREHLILKGKEKGIQPFERTKAVWKAIFNIEIQINTRFSAGELTYKCIEKIGTHTYRLMCERAGTIGNKKQGELIPCEYITGYERGELNELLIPARDDEETEAYRARYFSIMGDTQAVGGNRAQYKSIMHEIESVGACKIYRVQKEERRIKIYFLNNLFQTPNEALVADVQEIMDPLGKQGEGEGKAVIYHIVDICPCVSVEINVKANITIDTGYIWEDLLPTINIKLDEYYLELAKNWEKEDYLTVRILKVNAAIASVEGVIDVLDTELNGKEENISLDSNSIAVRGEVCRK